VIRPDTSGRLFQRGCTELYISYVMFLYWDEQYINYVMFLYHWDPSGGFPGIAIIKCTTRPDD